MYEIGRGGGGGAKFRCAGSVPQYGTGWRKPTGLLLLLRLGGRGVAHALGGYVDHLKGLVVEVEKG